MVKYTLGDNMNNTFIEYLSDIGIKLTEKQIKQFEIYYQLLIEWNEKMNLTAITEKDEVYAKHFYDSLCLNKAVDLSNQTILDVGSGAGFPSIPLKIVYPDLQITIIDSLNKRITFLKELCSKLDISATLIHGRAEEFDKKNSFDIVTARAVANLRLLGELCIPFVKKDGFFISLKGPKFIEEIKEGTRMLKELNASVHKTIEYEIEDNTRAIVIIKKENVSKNKYPRRFSKIKSNPL